jgi:pimeloyl-ACP methyl ester carboxylesterase
MTIAPVTARLMRRCALVLLALSLSASVLALPTATAQSRAARAAVPRLNWTSCYTHFQCTTATVPLDYDSPQGATIKLALIRLRAGDPSRRIGSIFINPGGPGGSGVDALRHGGRFLFSPEVQARFDIVGFDPRGIAASTPLRCFNTGAGLLAALPNMAFPVTREEEQTWIEADRAIAGACAQRATTIINHMSTANVARDMDLLRRAMGEQRLNFFGVSYGSYIGATYASMFPDNVRAVVVDGVLDPIAWSTGSGDERSLPVTTRLDAHRGSYATLRQFFTLCNEGEQNCSFSEGSPRRRYDDLAERLLDEPVEVPDGQGGTFTVGYDELVGFTRGAMYDPATWPFLADVLVQLEALSDPGDTAAALRTLRARLGAYNHTRYPQFEGGAGVICADSDNPDNVDSWARAARAADEEFPYFGRPWTWFSSLCEPWPGADADRYMGPFTKSTHNAVLVVGNSYDPATPYQGAVKLHRLLPKSRLITLEGWGHTSVFKSACVRREISGYLLQPYVPAPDATCQPDVVPFAQPVNARSAAASRDRAAIIAPLIRPLIGG